jgi:hypothetical protein
LASIRWSGVAKQGAEQSQTPPKTLMKVISKAVTWGVTDTDLMHLQVLVLMDLLLVLLLMGVMLELESWY